MAGIDVAPVTDLLQQYRSQFETTIEHLRRRGENLGSDAQQASSVLQSKAEALKNELQPQIEAKKNEVLQVVTDQSEVAGDVKYLLEVMHCHTTD